MKKTLSLLAVLALIGASVVASAQTTTAPKKPATKTSATTADAKPASATPALTDDKSKASYALGANMGTQLHRADADVDLNLVIQGLKDTINGGTSRMTEEEIRAALGKFSSEVRAKMEEKRKLDADKNKKEGEAFLEANKSNTGVITTPSGLQYKVLTEGKGPKPTATDTVTCNYRGTLLNGKEFDSSYKRKEPASFPVNGVIKGWTEALQMMPVGSKWQLFIPASLAYGERGAGADIEPNSTLIFEVELLSIKTKEQPKESKDNVPDAPKPNTSEVSPQK
ncbi:MAG TPA: FKBP-type peptidyl-prolyl cis-trans isomerase [candidate division Zixibacteria bacterium]|nr:FKBP-type peptidyl-prolyl cis-trans isomerase [candidate division Zixibacteria bacterium]